MGNKTMFFLQPLINDGFLLLLVFYFLIACSIFAISNFCLAQEKPRNKRISLDFENCGVREVIDYIAREGEQNIVLGKDVSGTVTIKMFDVPWTEALEMVVKLAGYTSKRFENIIYIDTPENIVNQTDYLSAFLSHKVRTTNLNTLLTKIEPLLSPKGKTFGDDRTGQIIVLDNIDVQQKVRALIESLDTPVRQIGVNVKVINVTDAFNEALEQKWNFPIFQVPIVRSLFTLNAQPSVAGYTQMKIGYRSLSDSFLQLNLLSEVSNAREIAGGYLLLQENCEGTITIGERFGVPVRDLAGNAVIQFFSSGFKLIITTHSIGGKKVKLNVKFEMSSLDRASALVGRPMISTYESEVELVLSDGETGIISRRIETELGAKESMPCCLDIPLIKYLFKPWSRVKNFTHQYILITPKIMS